MTQTPDESLEPPHGWSYAYAVSINCSRFVMRSCTRRPQGDGYRQATRRKLIMKRARYSHIRPVLSRTEMTSKWPS